MCDSDLFNNACVDTCIFEGFKAIADIVPPIFILQHINELDLFFVGSENKKDACIWFSRTDAKFYYAVSL